MDLFEIVGRLSIDGVDKAEKELNSVTNTGEKASGKMGKFLAGLGKTTLAITGAVATGSVALIKNVSSSYGALQQSIGGIETLFGSSAKKVIANANNAFSTAGISANEYMQQVTSFSASLLQSLGGDTEKACNVADRAVTDMADNANKMGTSMESIQNAYQGFAKQNFTMLDNLKLGYGGTKGEMQRLIKDASKMTDVQKKLGVTVDGSSMSFSNIINAISVMQSELGIAGATADEAGSTIEGSFNSLSASWQNFIAGLGNPDADMKQLVQNLATGLDGAIKNITPIINNMVVVLPTVMDAVINSVSQMLPTLINTFTELITKVIDAIVKLLPQFIPLAVDCILTVVEALIQNLPLLIEAGVLLISSLIEGINSALPTLLPLIVQVVVDVANMLVQNLPTLLDAVLQLVQGLVDGLISAIPTLIQALPVLISSIIDFLMTGIPQLTEAWITLLFTLIDAIPVIIDSILIALPQIVSSICTGLISNIPLLIDASIKFYMGLVQVVPLICVELVKALPQIIVTIMQCLAELLPSIGMLLLEILAKVGMFFRNLIETGVTKASEFVTKVVNFIKQLPEKFAYNFGLVLGKITRWVVDMTKKAKDGGKAFVNNVVNFIKNLPTNVAKFLTSTISKLTSFVTNAGKKAKEAGKNILNNVVNGIKSLPSKIKSIGSDVVKGLWNGIQGAGNWLKKKVTGFCSNIVEGFKKGFDSHSPARKLVPIGNWVTQGLGVGITEDDSAEKSMKNKVEDILDIASNTDANIKIGSSVDDIVTQSPLQKYQLDFNAQIGNLNDGFERLISLVGQYLPDISSNMDRNIVIDGDSLAVGMSRKMDAQLGKIAVSKGRGNV